MRAGKIRNVSATTTFLCVYSIAVAAVEKGYAFLFFGLLLLIIFLLAALLLVVVLVLLTTWVLKQREVPATVSYFYVSVVYTAMLRTSVAAVVLGCFYFLSFRLRYSGYGRWLRCCWDGMHAGKIQSGCTPGTHTKFSFSFSVWWDITTSAIFHSRTFCFRVNRLQNKIKPSNTTSGKATDMMAGICTFPRLPCPCTKTTCHAKP